MDLNELPQIAIKHAEQFVDKEYYNQSELFKENARDDAIYNFKMGSIAIEKHIIIQQLDIINSICREYNRLKEFHNKHPMQMNDATINNLKNTVNEIHQLKMRLKDISIAFYGNIEVDYKGIISKAISMDIVIPKHVDWYRIELQA